MVDFSAFLPRSCYMKFFVVVVIFRVGTTDSFSVSDASHRTKLSSENSFSSLILKENSRHCRQQTSRLSAVNNGRNDQNQPIADRSYDFIAIEEADKMLQQERLRMEQEIGEMKILLNRQQELLECDGLRDGLAYNMEFSNQEETVVIDLGFAGRDDINSNKDVEFSGPDINESPFSSPFPNPINEEQFRQQNQRSHDSAECRTIEFALRQIDQENEDLKNEFDSQQHRYQSNIEESQRLIYDLRDRSDCLQHELKLEHSYFESAKAELEEALDQQRGKERDLEQQLLVARREQEILKQAAVEAQQQQQQEFQKQEEQEERECQQREEQERKQQKSQQEQEEHRHHEDLLRNHQELVELEKNQKQFEDVYFSIYGDNSNDESANDNPVQNQSELEQNEIAVNGEHRVRQYENSGDSVRSTHSPQSMHIGQDNIAQQQQPQQQKQQPYQYKYQYEYQYHHQQDQQQYQAFSVAATTQISDNRPSRRVSKQNARRNSREHGIFMNFNDILV